MRIYRFRLCHRKIIVHLERHRFMEICPSVRVCVPVLSGLGIEWLKIDKIPLKAGRWRAGGWAKNGVNNMQTERLINYRRGPGSGCITQHTFGDFLVKLGLGCAVDDSAEPVLVEQCNQCITLSACNINIKLCRSGRART